MSGAGLVLFPCIIRFRSPDACRLFPSNFLFLTHCHSTSRKYSWVQDKRKDKMMSPLPSIDRRWHLCSCSKLRGCCPRRTAIFGRCNIESVLQDAFRSREIQIAHNRHLAAVSTSFRLPLLLEIPCKNGTVSIHCLWSTRISFHDEMPHLFSVGGTYPKSPCTHACTRSPMLAHQYYVRKYKQAQHW